RTGGRHHQVARARIRMTLGGRGRGRAWAACPVVCCSGLRLDQGAQLAPQQSFGAMEADSSSALVAVEYPGDFGERAVARVAQGDAFAVRRWQRRGRARQEPLKVGTFGELIG